MAHASFGFLRLDCFANLGSPLFHRDLARKALLHEAAYVCGILVARLQKHQFGQGSLDGGVVAADHSCVLEMESRVVAAHLDLSAHTLADVDHRDATVVSLAAVV